MQKSALTLCNGYSLQITNLMAFRLPPIEATIVGLLGPGLPPQTMSLHIE
jgi:hypothetical protein